MPHEKPAWMTQHENDDKEQFGKIHESIAALPTKEDLSKLATKDDIQKVVSLYNNLVLAGQIISTGGRWSYRALIGVAMVITLLGILTGGLKAAVIGIAAWAGMNQ